MQYYQPILITAVWSNVIANCHSYSINEAMLLLLLLLHLCTDKALCELTIVNAGNDLWSYIYSRK